MSKAEMGGPAFPEQRRVIRAGYETKEFEPCSGMTLRDYFAARAMLAMASSSNSNPNTILPVCENAYRWADAMLKARKP